MGEVLSTYYAFSSSAGNAATLIANFSNLPKVADSLRIDIPRIGHLEKLADEIEKALAEARRILEEVPPLTTLDDLKTSLSILQEKYEDCFQQWRRERGRELTPPRLWQRLRNVEKALKGLYQDVCDSLEDHLDVKEAERRLADPNEVPVPYEQARKELGLD
jgi:ubiquinone/menaquinone biosynthesis C-methylase UbiE